MRSPLRAAEYMTGGHQRHGDVADLEGLAISDRLAAARRLRPKSHLHDGEGLARGEHRVVTRAGMVR